MTPSLSLRSPEPSQPLRAHQPPIEPKLVKLGIDPVFLEVLRELDFRTAKGEPLWEKPLQEMIDRTQEVFFRKAGDDFAKAIRGELNNVGSKLAFEVREAAEQAQKSGAVQPPSELLIACARRLGMIDEVRPSRESYEEVHVGGATAPAIQTRLAALADYCTSAPLAFAKLVCAGGERDITGKDREWIQTHLGISAEAAVVSAELAPFLKNGLNKDQKPVIRFNESEFTAWLVRRSVAAGDAPPQFASAQIVVNPKAAAQDQGKVTAEQVAGRLASGTPDGVSVLFIGSQPFVPRLAADYCRSLQDAGVRLGFIEGAGPARESPVTRLEIAIELAKQLKAEAAIIGQVIPVPPPVSVIETGPSAKRLAALEKVQLNFELPITPDGRPTTALAKVLERLVANLGTDSHQGSAPDLTSPKEIYLFTQSYFERYKALHAANVALMTQRTADFSDHLELYRPLGMVDGYGTAQLGPEREFETALLFGGALPRMLDRLEHLITLWNDGVRFDRLVLLGSNRKIAAATDRFDEPNLERMGKQFERLLGQQLDPKMLLRLDEATLLLEIVNSCTALPKEWRQVGFKSLVAAPLIMDPEVPKKDPGAYATLRTLSSSGLGVEGEYIFGRRVLCALTQQYAARMATDTLRCAMQLADSDSKLKIPEVIATAAPTLPVDGMIRENQDTLAQELAKFVHNSYLLMGYPVAAWKSESQRATR